MSSYITTRCTIYAGRTQQKLLPLFWQKCQCLWMRGIIVTATSTGTKCMVFMPTTRHDIPKYFTFSMLPYIRPVLAQMSTIAYHNSLTAADAEASDALKSSCSPVSPSHSRCEMYNTNTHVRTLHRQSADDFMLSHRSAHIIPVSLMSSNACLCIRRSCPSTVAWWQGGGVQEFLNLYTYLHLLFLIVDENKRTNKTYYLCHLYYRKTEQ